MTPTPERPFPKTMRLAKPSEFKRVFASGRRLRTRSFILIAFQNNLGSPRLGLAISRKNARRAVDRNRIKRIIRESFRRHAIAIDAVDIVVQATPKAVTQSNAALFSTLADCWQDFILPTPGQSLSRN